MLWLIFALVATALWGFTNLIDSDLLERRRQNPNTLTFVTGVFGSMPVLLLLLLPVDIPPAGALIAALGAGAIGLFVYWPYYQALERTHTVNVILLWNLAPVLVVFFSWLFLNEQLDAKQYVALILLVASSFLTGYQPTSSHRIPLAAAAWMLLASITTAVEYTLLGYVFQELSILDGIVWVSVGILAATILIPIFIPTVRRQIVHTIANAQMRRRFALNELLDLAASLCRMVAIRLGSVGLVSAVGGLQSLFVLGFTPFFKSRRTPPSRLLVAVAAALGVIGLGLLAQDI